MKHCKGNSGYQIGLFSGSASLPAAWNDFLPREHFLRSSHLRLYEEIGNDDVDFLYLTVSNDCGLVGLAYFQILHIRHKHLDSDKLKGWQKPGWSLFTGWCQPKLLVAGHLFRHDICSFYWKDGMAHYEAYKAYRTAIDFALQHSGASAALVKDVNETLIPYFQHYAPQFLMLSNDISMEMLLPDDWNHIDDYERALKHKYAQRFRKVRQPWSHLRVEELSAADSERQKGALYRLYHQVIVRQQVRLGLLNENFLPVLHAHNEHLKIWMVYEGENPVAFFSAWTRGRVFDMFYIGLDYAENERLQLYFNILFFSVEQAIGLKKEKLVLGRTALEAKARIGCTPKYLSTYVYIKNPIVRGIVMRMQQQVSSREGEWENRHPFKK